MVEPVEALERIAYLLERSGQPTYRVRAFRRAAETIRRLDADDVLRRAAQDTLTDLSGIGKATATVVREALAGEVPAYLQRLEAELPAPVEAGGQELRARLRGDCHTHSDWSDGGSPVAVMARAARDLGHEWVALTDHSPRLKVARGLSADRLRQQLDLVEQVNADLSPFRVFTGIEVDICDDGSLDQTDELLGRLDVVVASVHSKLRMPRADMTRRLLAAVANPHTDVLGHCTGRLVTGKGRPESEFDHEAVFAACADHEVAVEVNSRPERLDPPRRLLRAALAAGCLLSIDTDAHAPGQLEWQTYGCARAAECGADPDRVVTAWTVEQLLAWTSR